MFYNRKLAGRGGGSGYQSLPARARVRVTLTLWLTLTRTLAADDRRPRRVLPTANLVSACHLAIWVIQAYALIPSKVADDKRLSVDFVMSLAYPPDTAEARRAKGTTRIQTSAASFVALVRRALF